MASSKLTPIPEIEEFKAMNMVTLVDMKNAKNLGSRSENWRRLINDKITIFSYEIWDVHLILYYTLDLVLNQIHYVFNF